MNLDIRSAVVTAYILMALGAAALFVSGLRAVRAARTIPFYRVRGRRAAAGWRAVFFALLLGGLALGLSQKGETVAYRYFPPSPTPSRTPTITLTPTISLTPTITLSPTITPTPAVSDTPTPPSLPSEVAARFVSSVTPRPDAVFSPLVFSQSMERSVAINPATTFVNPVGHLYATFSYDKLAPGVQWSALWFRNGTLVYYETKPWDGTTGGYGFTDWNPPPHEWLPGTYTVAIFVGTEFKVAGQFTVLGDAPTPRPTATQTPTPTATRTPRPTDTRWPSPTP